MLDGFRAGALDPLIGGRHELEQARQAMDAVAGRRSVGKVLLLPHIP